MNRFTYDFLYKRTREQNDVGIVCKLNALKTIKNGFCSLMFSFESLL